MRPFVPLLQIFGLLGGAFALLLFVEGGVGGPRDRTSTSRPRDRFEEDLLRRAKKRPYRPYHLLTVYKPEKSSPGFTLFGVNEAEEVLLLDHKGAVRASWPIDSDRAVLLKESCSLLATHGTVAGSKVAPWDELRYFLREYDLGGDALWEYRSEDILHHDVRALHDADTFLSLRRRLVPYRGALNYKENFQVKADGIVVVNRSGDEVFSWNSEEHLPHDFCGIRECPSVEETEVSRAELKRRKDWTHANTVSEIPKNRWFDAGDERFRPGNFLLHVRNFWMSFIIERESKEIVWQFPKKEEFESSPELRIRGGHESHMIAPGLPGAGNILILDNGNIQIRPYSRILEIDPVARKIVWSYEDRAGFFTRTAGATQRLPNGNTLISEDLRGRVFEVTPQGEVVWEVRTPFRTARARRYPLDWCE
ncbi:arylsulfotransferase family protein [bacterium]|nr:arylsulfotransferase family protein [bacterium]